MRRSDQRPSGDTEVFDIAKAIDEGNRFLVRAMRTGLVKIEDLAVTQPLTNAEALNLARWLMSVANPLLAQWIASQQLNPPSAYSKDVHDFRDAMRKVLATPK